MTAFRSPVNAARLQDLTDVSVTGATDGQVLAKNGASWLPSSVVGASALWQSVKDAAYGAKGDGTTNDTTAIQAAIDAVAAANGGVVFFPSGTYIADGLILKNGVTLTSGTAINGVIWLSIPTVLIKAPVSSANSWVIDTVATGTVGTNGAAINGINIDGRARVGGINFRYPSGATGNVGYNAVRNCHIDNCSDQGIVSAFGTVANTFENVLITNVLLTKPRSALNGAMELRGTDCYCSNLEVGGLPSTATGVSDVNRRAVAILVSGGTHMFVNSVGEFGDTGFHVSGDGNRFSACRADHNFGDGFVVAGAANTFSACIALDNSYKAANTYDGFVVSGGGNAFSACSIYTATDAHKYGVRDTYTGGGAGPYRNQYAAISIRGTATADWNVATSGASGPVHGGAPVDISSGATPSVVGTTVVTLSHASPITITNFLNGTQGQALAVRGTANITIQHGINIYTNTGADKTLAANRMYRYTLQGGIWYEDADRWAYNEAEQTLTYGATVNTDLSLGAYAMLVVTNGTAFTIANPTNPTVGQILTYEITNTSGGAMGAITWGSEFIYRDGSFVAPANNKRRVIQFRRRSSGHWIQLAPATADM